MTAPRSLTLTAQQMAALVVMEMRINALNAEAGALKQLGADGLAVALASAADALTKAHEAFVVETQTAVKLASPSDMPRLVAP